MMETDSSPSPSPSPSPHPILSLIRWISEMFVKFMKCVIWPNNPKQTIPEHIFTIIVGLRPDMVGRSPSHHLARALRSFVFGIIFLFTIHQSPPQNLQWDSSFNDSTIDAHSSYKIRNMFAFLMFSFTIRDVMMALVESACYVFRQMRQPSLEEDLDILVHCSYLKPRVAATTLLICTAAVVLKDIYYQDPVIVASLLVSSLLTYLGARQDHWQVRMALYQDANWCRNHGVSPLLSPNGGCQRDSSTRHPHHSFGHLFYILVLIGGTISFLIIMRIASAIRNCTKKKKLLAL